MRVLVTRPQEDAAKLVAALAARGIGALCAPLLEVHYIAGNDLDLGGVQGLLFTSANGVRAFARRSPERTLPALCVGDATASEARTAGFADVTSAQGDVEDLARLVQDRLDPSRGALLHAAAGQLAGDLGGALTAAGFTYRREALYETLPARTLPPAALGALADGKLDGVLLYSPRTAKAFAQLVAAAGLASKLAAVSAYCLSAAVAGEIHSLPWKRVEIAARPEQDALLERVSGA